MYFGVGLAGLHRLRVKLLLKVWVELQRFVDSLRVAAPEFTTNFIRYLRNVLSRLRDLLARREVWV
jgi:hypothetical protein